MRGAERPGMTGIWTLGTGTRTPARSSPGSRFGPSTIPRSPSTSSTSGAPTEPSGGRWEGPRPDGEDGSRLPGDRMLHDKVKRAAERVAGIYEAGVKVARDPP